LLSGGARKQFDPEFPHFRGYRLFETRPFAKITDAGEHSAWTKAKNTIRCQGERL